MERKREKEEFREPWQEPPLLAFQADSGEAVDVLFGLFVWQ